MAGDPAEIFISLRFGASHFNCCALLAAVAAVAAAAAAAVAAAAEARELCSD